MTKKKNNKGKTPNKKRLLIAGCVVGVVALIVAACVFLGKDEEPAVYNPQRGPLKELTVGSTERQGEMMVVDTSYGNVKFPYAFSDLIGVEALNQGNQTALTFTARIDGQNEELYTIWFNGSKGMTAGSMDLQDGETPITVTLVIYNPGRNLSGDDLTTFYATQETVNDVLSSLEETGNFIPAE